MPDANDPSFGRRAQPDSTHPARLSAIHARPMFLGLDLQGGVHFMLQVDMQAALTKGRGLFR